MKPQKQLFRHRPQDGIFGDCHRTAIACVLDMDAKDVPHFMDGAADKGEGEKSHDRAEAWLNARGIATINILYPGETPIDEMLSTVAACNPRGKPVFILGGESRNGVNHSVACCDGEIVCDPSQDDSGIIGPCDDGFYWLTFFGTLAATDSPAKHKRDAAGKRDRLDVAASLLSGDLIAAGMPKGSFYITIGDGELHVYAKAEALAGAARERVTMPCVYPVEWHVQAREGLVQAASAVAEAECDHPGGVVVEAAE
jgi:hypothetical protein